MTNFLGKTRITPTTYIKNISIDVPKKAIKNKISDDTFMIPDISEYNYMLQHNFKIAQLKKICKYYKLKQSGNKGDLLNRVYNYLRISHACTIIQKLTRKFFYKQYKLSQGPAVNSRDICINETDFLTMEYIKDIPNEQFFSMKDDEGHIYGFNVISIWNLYLKNGRSTSNPYNRKKFPDNIYHSLCIFLSYSQILKKNVVLNIKNEEEELPPEKRVEVKTLSLFQHMDSLGNYTDVAWFNNLSSWQLVKFIRELQDIWCYRAQLSNDVKREICPPTGEPFRNININSINSGWEKIELRKLALGVIDSMITTGINNENQSLGTMYVLSALTLVSYEASIAMPWLHQSVV